MSASDIYRQRALELCQRANAQSNFDIRTEYESLAFAYMCLAEQTESDLLEWACVDAAKDLGLNRPSQVNAPGRVANPVSACVAPRTRAASGV